MFVHWCRTHWYKIGLAFAFLLPWIVFGRSLFQDFSPIDDSFLIINNPIVHGIDWQRIKLAFTTFDPELYIPLTILSFQWDWFIGGGSPLPFHLTNLVLHSLNAVLVGLLVRRVSNSFSISIVVALLFSVHPLHTEAVVWAAGRKDLLCTFFFLLSYLAFLRGIDTHRNFFFAASLFLFFLALFSKTLAAILPIILLLHVTVVRKDSVLRKHIFTLIPFIVASLAFLYIATLGKERILSSSPVWETFVMAQKSAAFYMQQLLFPSGLTPIYEFRGVISLFRAEFFLPALVHLSLLILAIRCIRVRPIISYCIFFYYISLSPTFFNVHKGDAFFFAVDRYAYIASIGFLMLAALIVRSMLRRLTQYQGVYGASLLTAILAVLVFLSIMQTRTWDSPDSLFTRTLSLYPSSVVARVGYTSILRERNQLEEAFALAREGLRYGKDANLYIEAALIYTEAGLIEDARENFLKALALNPVSTIAEFYLGVLDEHEGNTEKAERRYAKAVENDSSHISARVALARLLLKRSSVAEAERQLHDSLAWNPVSLEASEAMIALADAKNDAAMRDYWTARTQWLRQ